MRAQAGAAVGICRWCGRRNAPLQLHHLDHDHTNDDPSNHVLLCRSCHGKAGRR